MSRHTYISAIKAHDPMLGITELMSLKSEDVSYIKKTIEKNLERESVSNKKSIAGKKGELDNI